MVIPQRLVMALRRPNGSGGSVPPISLATKKFGPSDFTCINIRLYKSKFARNCDNNVCGRCVPQLHSNFPSSQSPPTKFQIPLFHRGFFAKVDPQRNAKQLLRPCSAQTSHVDMKPPPFTCRCARQCTSGTKFGLYNHQGWHLSSKKLPTPFPN